jgi:hypothetical protein
MSKNSTSHKNYIELRPIVDGKAIDKVKVPFGALKPMTLSTKVRGTDRVFIVGAELAQILEKYS